jgi:hypothetical protein
MFILLFLLSFFQLSQTYIQDYGTLLCYGSNELGTQTEPCVYTIFPAGKQKRDWKRIFLFSSFSFQFSTPTSLSKIFFSLFLYLLCELSLSMHDYIFGVGLGSPQFLYFLDVVDVLSNIIINDARQTRSIVQLFDIESDIWHAANCMPGRLRRWSRAEFHCWNLCSWTQEFIQFR